MWYLEGILLLLYLPYKIVICIVGRIFLILNDPMAFLTVTTKVEKSVPSRRRSQLGFQFSVSGEKD